MVKYLLIAEYVEIIIDSELPRVGDEIMVHFPKEIEGTPHIVDLVRFHIHYPDTVDKNNSYSVSEIQVFCTEKK